MNDEEREILAEKVKNKTATEEEVIMLVNELTRIVDDINNKLDNK